MNRNRLYVTPQNGTNYWYYILRPDGTRSQLGESIDLMDIHKECGHLLGPDEKLAVFNGDNQLVMTWE